MTSSFPYLAALALTLFALPASAQDEPQATVVETEQADLPQNTPEAISTAARNILELVEVHHFRMRRIDAAIQYYSSIPDQDKVRQFSLLREREMNQYQKSLETYRRMLGDADFTRVAGLLRNHFEKDRLDPNRRDEVAAADDARAERDTTAERAERVRRLMAAQAAEARQRATDRAAEVRGQQIERMRASQRAQLAQRLALARATQMEARAAAERRYQPMRVSPSQRRADPSRGGGFGGPFGGRGRGRMPWGPPPQRR